MGIFVSNLISAGTTFDCIVCGLFDQAQHDQKRLLSKEFHSSRRTGTGKIRRGGLKTATTGRSGAPLAPALRDNTRKDQQLSALSAEANLLPYAGLDGYSVYEVLVLQLGSFARYRLYNRGALLHPGTMLQCRMYRRRTNPISYALLPTTVRGPLDLPQELAAELDLDLEGAT